MYLKFRYAMQRFAASGDALRRRTPMTKTWYSGGKRYDVEDRYGEKAVTTPTWWPGLPEYVGWCKNDKEALDLIKSDSGSNFVKRG
jgi:hypothetical protein